jgi:RNA-binding protein
MSRLTAEFGLQSAVPITLTPRERAHLKARAHSLEPVVRVGHAGVTERLLAEADRALTAHELIKVRIDQPDREERVAIGDAFAKGTDAVAVHRVGKVLILWRPRPQDATRQP